MLRRPLTSITLTPEDVAAYETRRVQREYDAQRRYEAESSSRHQTGGVSVDISFTSTSSQEYPASTGGAEKSSSEHNAEVRAAMREMERAERELLQREKDKREAREGRERAGRAREERMGVSTRQGRS
ncbi:hypothetical protein EV356DRAFT_514652 [Viridothelium virens]|uniref:Anaphase-promoting complex, subunit CDC26 n=1 Tax=Viridothelium virens TaxID=1048519 RepID=A0A6A6HB05_VIRVR|nr:hypothetical protein EV356DRAFT_514652 [Viridothelium virens]